MKIYHVEAGMLATNCYFAVNEAIGEGVIFDPGGDYPTIKRMIEQAKAKVVAIVLTHGHSDHTGAANAVKKRYNIPICAHKWEVPVLDDEAISFSSMFSKWRAAVL